jgi:hypothetical protein
MRVVTSFKYLNFYKVDIAERTLTARRSIDKVVVGAICNYSQEKLNCGAAETKIALAKVRS